MSFSKAKLKRFNDVDVTCGSPATTIKLSAVSASDLSAGSATASSHSASATSGVTGGSATAAAAMSAAASSNLGAHPERKEQIEKFFKDAVRFASSSKEAKEFAIPKEGGAIKEDKKSRGLRLFRTPSLPHRLRFRSGHNSAGDGAATSGSSTASSTPLHSATTTPVKELPKSASRLKGKEALQQELRTKSELIESYTSQLDVLRRHVEQLQETEQKLRLDNANVTARTDSLIYALQTENSAHKECNEQLSGDNAQLSERIAALEAELGALGREHAAEVAALRASSAQLQASNAELQAEKDKHCEAQTLLQGKIVQLEREIGEARVKLDADERKTQQNFELIENLKNTNDALITDVRLLQTQIEQDALAYAQEMKISHNEMDCLKTERNALKEDLASKCEFIRALQDELLDKNCEIDAHCDTIRQLCREKSKYVERERLMDAAEEQIRCAEQLAEQQAQKLESDLENALEREKAYWRGELEKRQKLAENELIKVELEKQDVMVLLESTNDMLRERDDKLQKCEEQLRNGIDYYVQLNDTLQKQIVDLKQDMAKTITEKYNYQLTLSNTRSTVNILMERLKKSDSDVEQLKAELESVQLAKGALEQSYLVLQSEIETLRAKLSEREVALKALHASSQSLQHEVYVKENIFNEILTSEEATLAKFNKIASSFQERIDTDAARYLDLYNELKCKDETRESYMQDMKKALDEFATVLQYAQLELDSKEKALGNTREECEQLKLENISLKSKLDESTASLAKKGGNSTDLEKIEDLLIDSELRAECDKITSWLLGSSEKSVRDDSTNEINELLKPSTPNGNKSRNCTTPVRSSAGKIAAMATTGMATTPTSRTPRTPKTSHTTPRTTPKKTVLFATGKENVLSPQKQVLKARNM